MVNFHPRANGRVEVTNGTARVGTLYPTVIPGEFEFVPTMKPFEERFGALDALQRTLTKELQPC